MTNTKKKTKKTKDKNSGPQITTQKNYWLSNTNPTKDHMSTCVL